MRQDPDIIMVGEIRDLATAEMAIQAALTGHLVFSTLHTNDAASAITRLVDLGVPPYLISATVIGVLAQRLARTLCPACKQPDDDASRDVLDEVARPWRLKGGVRPYKPVGCLECRHTGYRGRAGLYELLLLDDDGARVRSIRTTTSPRCASRRCSDGMRPLRLAGAMKVAEGVDHASTRCCARRRAGPKSSRHRRDSACRLPARSARRTTGGNHTRRA